MSVQLMVNLAFDLYISEDDIFLAMGDNPTSYLS